MVASAEGDRYPRAVPPKEAIAIAVFENARIDRWNKANRVCTMRRFSTIHLDRSLGDVKATATREQVILTRHRNDRFVLMAAENVEQLRRHADPQRAFGAGGCSET
jgi:hypothetical protein